MPDHTATTDVQDALDRMRGAGHLRVWSVIVTIMGDMARGSGQTVSGATLKTLTGELGIRPEATRVALHRLRKDGWIESHRSGRGSRYLLTEHGRGQTLSVERLIYGPARSSDVDWHLAITAPSGNTAETKEALISQGFSELSSGIFLGCMRPLNVPEVLHFTDASPDLPNWLVAQLLPANLRDDASALSQQIGSLDDQSPSRLSAQKRAALRILALHAWRRIALRLPDLPLQSLWPDARLRDDVHSLLDRLGPIDADALSG